MRLQLDLAPVDLGPAERFTAPQAGAVAEQVQALLTGAGFEVTVSEDRAEVDRDNPDWALLTPEERDAGGFTYPEVVIDGPARAVVDVFLRSVFISTDPDFDAEQAATAQVMRALHAISPLVVIRNEVRRDVEQAAADQKVSPDGSILRPILSRSELSTRAIALFDAQRSPERDRPAQARSSPQLATLGDHTMNLPPFRASIAADPSGSTFGYELPHKPPFTSDNLRPLRKAMKAIIDAALDEADELTGLPTGLVVQHDENGTIGTLVFDNPVDSGAMNPASQGSGHRSAPFAWENITARAAQRDPTLQPTWLLDAIDLLAAGGTDVTINSTSTLIGRSTVIDTSVESPTPLATAAKAAEPRLRNRLRRWFGG